MSRAAVVFPGRGAYTPASLGSLTSDHPWVARADELRGEAGLAPLSELDGSHRFDPAVHRRPVNAWPLTFVASLLDAERIAVDHEVVVVVASSTGWYTALAATGVLRFDDAFRLVMALAMAAEQPLDDGARAAELIYPLADAAWGADPDASAALKAALAENGRAWRALELGAFAIVAGSEEAIERLAPRLPARELAGRSYPLRLAGGDVWHTPGARAVSGDAAAALTALGWERPNVALVDGRGRRYTPWSGDPAEIAAYTLEEQPRTTYDFATSFRVALREYAPDVILLPGPGTSLGAACAQLIVADGYRGIRSRTDLEAAQRSAEPVLLSMRR